ncbi:MAG TPA: HYR domain-containing protein, partial [Sediminibacterium sp.]
MLQTTAKLSAKLLLVVGFIFFFQSSVSSQAVLNNSKLRFGTGTEASVNNTGNLQQPFYYNGVLSLWRKLTFSSYSLDNAFAIGGVKTNEWNLNGTMVQNPVLSNQTIDLSGYVATGVGTGYGTIVSTGTTVIGGLAVEIRNTYTLPQNNAYITVTTRLRNISSALMENVRIWIGTRDDWVGDTDGPRKQKGNLVNGAFAQVSSSATRAAAIQITSGSEGVLFYTNSTRGNTVVNSCCSFTNVTNQDPSTSSVDISNDGSYAFYVRMNDLAVGDVDEFTWYYAAGELANLNTIINQVAVAGAVSNITYTSATLTAKTPVASTGYWMVVPSGSATPSPAQIKTGTNYGAVTVVSSGSGAMAANVDATFNLSGLSANTQYIVHFVSQAADLSYSSILSVPFTTQAYTVPTVSTSAVSSVTTVTAASGGNVTNSGGQNITARGVCWNTSASPTIANSKTVDGSGTGVFSSSLSGLLPSTTYYLRAYATNATGTSYGNEIVFTTASQIPAGALDFGGVDDYVNLGALLASNASYTREAWVFNGNPGSPNNNIFSTFNDPVYIPGGYLNVTQGNSSGVVDPDPFPVSTWTHVAVTYDKPTTTLKLYVNGVLKATNTNAPAFTGGTLFLGKHPTGGGTSSVGMDEVRFWNRALCREEILNNMNAAISGPQSGLVALYNFNQGFVNANNAGVTTLTDASGNGNNGTLVGFTLSGTSSNWIAGTVTGTAAPFVAPVAPITGTTTLCVGATSTLTNSNTGGVWTSGNPSVAGISAAGVVTAVAPGTSTITYTNSCGGVSTTTITVNALPTVTISANGPSSFCGGGNVVLTASAGSSYLWSNNATTQSITVSNSGSYTVTVSNGTCSATSAPTVVTVSANPNLYSITGGGIYCSGSAGMPVGLSSSQLNVTYQLLVNGSATGSPVAGTGSAISFGNQTAAGTYTVSATVTAGGCTSAMTGSVAIAISPLPTVNTIADQAVCATTNTAAINFTGAVPGTVYQWTNSSPSIGIAATGTGNIASFAAINATNAPVTANFTVTPSTGGGGNAYIPSISLNNVSVIKLSDNTITATIPVGTSPYGVAVSPDGSKVYVANRSSSNVSVISTASNTVTATITAGSVATGVAVSADGSKLYVSNEGASNVMVFNTATNTLLNTISVGSGPRSILLSADGTKLYTFNYSAGSISVISVATNTVIATITVGSFPNGGALSADGARLVVVNYSSNTLSVINTSTNTIVSTISTPVNSGVWHARFTPDGSKLYVTGRSIGQVYVYDAVTYALLTTINGVSGPTGIDFSADGSMAYIPSLSATAYVINTSSNSIVTTINASSANYYGIGNFIQQGSGAACTGASTSFSIVVNPKPTATITAGGSTTFCSGGSVTLTASAGTSYLWSTGATSQSITVSSSGSYTVKVTNASGCETTSAATVVTVQSLPTVTIAAAGGTSVCPGNTVTLNATTTAGTGSISNYQWYKDGTIINGANGSTYAAPVTGVYSVTVFNTANCSASSNTIAISVADITPPVFTGQPQIITAVNTDGSITATSAQGAIVNYSLPAAADNCSGSNVSVVATPASGSVFPLGSTEVTYIATDAAGLTATGTFTITVSGALPVISCPANIVVNSAAGQCGANVNFAATETAGIPASAITYSIQPGSFFAVGTHTVTATATNAVGSSVCTFTITVADNIYPVLTGVPANVTVPCNAVPAVANVTATDNCSTSAPVFTEVRTAGDCPNNYILTRTWS